MAELLGRAESDGHMVPEHRGRWEEDGIGGKTRGAQAGRDREVSFGCDTHRTSRVRYLLLVGLHSWAA